MKVRDDLDALLIVEEAFGMDFRKVELCLKVLKFLRATEGM